MDPNAKDLYDTAKAICNANQVIIDNSLLEKTTLAPKKKGIYETIKNQDGVIVAEGETIADG